MQPRTYGILLVTIATVMWSSVGLFVRMLDTDVWTVLGWRSVFGGATLVLISLASRRDKTLPRTPTPFLLYAGLGVLSAISMAGYIGALRFTSVANVLSIYGTLPFIAAGLSYVFLDERIERRALIASCVAFAGILVVAGFAMRGGDLIGNGLALFMTLTFAALLVLSRKYKSLRLAPINAIGSGLCVLLCLPLMPHVMPSPLSLAILALFGATTVGTSYLLYMMGGRLIPAGEAGLIGLLDIVLGPLWVWLAFRETPQVTTIIGGGVILAAVFWYMLSGLRESSIRKADVLKSGGPAWGAARIRPCD